MRLTYIVVFLAGALAPVSTFGADGTACDAGCSASQPDCQLPAPCAAGNACAYVKVDAMFLQLDRAKLPVLTTNQNTGATVLSMSDLNFRTEGGPRLTIGGLIDECTTAEVVYFGLYDWHASAGATGANDLRLPGDLAFASHDFYGADAANATYTARLHNAEINGWRDVDCTCLSIMAGLRYINFQERFGLRLTDVDLTSADYNVGTENSLIGAQIGGRLHGKCGAFGLELTSKTGVFNNSARQNTFVSDVGAPAALRDSITNGNHTAFVSELELLGSVCLTNHISARAGYEFMWIAGIARSPDQLDFTDTATSGTALNTSGTAFVHGATVGLELHW